MTGVTFLGPATDPVVDPPANDGSAPGSGCLRDARGRSGRVWSGHVLRASAPASLRAGDRLAGTPYRVLRPLGQGGMGEVYEVEHVVEGFHGALKVLRPQHRDRVDLAERLRQEARLLAAVDHPAVVRLLDAGETRDLRPYLVMELLHGQDLQEIIAGAGPLPVPEALLLIAEALDGLDAIHAAGIVHRDVKLENLFVSHDGNLKVIDFGVAKACWTDASPTVPGVSLGTPRMMAPEQGTQKGADPRVDIYAAGLSLYELCAGRGPFDELRDQPHALRFAHCTRRPPRPADVSRQPIPPDVEDAILRALAKAPEDRFQSAREMAVTLRRLATGAPRRAEPKERAQGAREAAALAPVLAPVLAPARLPTPRPSAPRSARSATRRQEGRDTSLFLMLALVSFGLGLIFGRALGVKDTRGVPALSGVDVHR